MQCQSYLPVYQFDYDLNVDTNSCLRVMHDGNATFLSGNYNNHVSILQVLRSNSDYKELLRQTMLMHEVTFRDQVQELHRLYKRHRETITEIKSKEINLNVHFEVQSSNSSLPILSSSGGHKTDDIQSFFHSNREFKTPNVPLALRNDGTLEKLSGYKCKIIGGRPLDLELPAEMYIDSDEWDSLQESQYPEDPTSANLSSNKHGNYIVEADGKASRVNLVDLNEPPTTLNFENSDSPPEVLSSSCGSSDKMPSHSIGTKPLVVQALATLDSHYHSRKNAKYSRRSKWSVKRNLDFGPSSGKTLTDVVAEEKSAQAVQKNGISCVNPLDDVSLRKSKRCRVIDINLSCDHASDDELFTDDYLLGELAEVAAQAIVSMSAFPETKICQHSQVSDSKTLEWFAELVNDFETLTFNEFDDFEAMTLNLTETKSEEYVFPGNSTQTCSASTTVPTKKGRTRRPKIKKDFQREVLPSLASLSRYEVSEDMQMIEGLMEAAGTPWHLRTRRACRMGRKPQAIMRERMPSADPPELKVEFGFSWGIDNKRPRGHRSPVSSDAIMSRWVELVV
ncbi:hypothetical protein RND81_02G036300 [Saponaria officinalis]|uniref:Uncharacterized protein n=1 Tax=Saponaria officinalis TaxID=3572 RepID=A0AAW1MV12_SAPOF